MALLLRSFDRKRPGQQAMPEAPSDKCKKHMLDLVVGGAASGKSEYAERLALGHSGHKFYLATMYNDGSESARYRISRHRKLREGKGFETIECSSHLEKAARFLRERDDAADGAVILLEDLPNLLANEMFSNSGEAYRTEQILEPVWKLAASYDIVVVSANVFEDGGRYDESTEQYIRSLAELHSRITESPYCKTVTEVVCGIPILLKGEK